MSQLATQVGQVKRPPRRRSVTAALRPRDQFLLLALPLAMFTLFFILPNVLNFVYAFTNWNTYHSAVNFVGWSNFVNLFQTGTLVNDIRNTLVFATLVAVFQNTAGLVLALGLEKVTRGNTVLRTIFFIPVLMSPLAIGFLFKGILAYDGPINQFLSVLAGHAVHVGFLTSINWTIVVVSAVQAWKFFGFSMLIYIAGLAAIPEELGEAAKLDGASPWQAFWHVRWRMLAPALTVNIVLSLIGSLNSFDGILATTDGGPIRATEVFNMYIFNTFGQGLFGQSTAMSLVLFLTVALIGVPLIIFLRKREIEA